MTYEERSDTGFNNHANGYAFELKNANIEKRLAILAITSAGSRSPIDIVSFRKQYVLLISCKANGYHTPQERRALMKLKNNLPSYCKIQLRYKVGRKIRREWL